MSWTHTCCEQCWIRREIDLTSGNMRLPTRVKGAQLEGCCFCGNPTFLGIYVRANPEDMHCVHDEEERADG